VKTINALKVRTKFGAVLEELKRDGQPLLLSRGGRVEAALVPIDLFMKRFVDLLGSDALEEVLQELKGIQAKPRFGRLSQLDLRQMRGALL